MKLTHSMLVAVATAAAALVSIPAALSAERSEPAAATLPFDMSERQRQAVASMPAVEVSYHKRGTVRLIEGHTGITLSRTARAMRKEGSGKEVLAALRNVLLVSGEEELRVLSNEKYVGSQRTLVLEQSIAGIPVIGGIVGIGVDEASGAVSVIKAEFLPDRGLPRTPKLTPSEATEAARTAVYDLLGAAPQSAQFSTKPALAYVGSNDLVDRPALVWVVRVSYLEERGGMGERDIWIDAVSGEFMGSQSHVRHLNRTVYTANGAAPSINSLPDGTTLLFTEGNAGGTNTPAVVAYGNVGIASDAWKSYVWTTDVPNLGIVVDYAVSAVGGSTGASVRASNGKEWLLFEAGNSTTLPGAMERDVVAHEYGHTLLRIRQPGLLGGMTESSALQEVYADYSAVISDIKVHNATPAATTWEIGPVYYSGKVVRSWSAPRGAHVNVPGYDWYPTAPRASQYYHEVSTIIGHAHYLLAQGGRNASYGQPGIPDIVVPGQGWDTALLVLATAVDDPRMIGNPSFLDFRKASETTAANLNPETLDATKRAFDAVGVGYACTTGPQTPNMDLEDLLCRGRYIMRWNAVPGATHYYAERVRAGYPWALAVPVVDADVTSCSGAVGVTTQFRLKACNGCGCSAFTPSQTVQWRSICP